MKLVSGLLLLAACLGLIRARGQTYVTPMMGGGQVTADMMHIDVYYDSEANQLYARADLSAGTPQLRPLDPGLEFDPQQPYAVLNGQAYNAQYGWNVGGFFALPPGAAIWIELLRASPGLETYSGWGRLGSYDPIFGTGGSPKLWKWSGVMTHNTYAASKPLLPLMFAEYHIYFGDAETGSQANFAGFGDTTIRLEWTVTPIDDPTVFRFGAFDQTNGAPLCFVNAGQFVTNSLAVVNLTALNSTPGEPVYSCSIPMLALPATSEYGGPATNHAARGACLAFESVELSGPPGGRLSFFEPGAPQPAFTICAGDHGGTNRFLLTENPGGANADPYGAVEGRCFSLTTPGLYCLGFRVLDTSTNGAAGAPIHTPSPVYRVYLQAGLTIASLRHAGASTSTLFGGAPGANFYLERRSSLDGAANWLTVAGPLSGTNRLQTLTDTSATAARSFYRLRSE